MKTPLGLLHLLAFLTIAQRTWGAEVPPGVPARVGDLGTPAKLSIEGVQTFTEGDIRRALQSDLDYLVAAHPEATLAGCLAALEDRVRAGYRDCGFPGASVQPRLDVSAGRIVAKVTEGPRFRWGALRVTGLESVPVADFIRRFAEKLAPPSGQTAPPSGTWKAGVPASFSPGSLANYSAAASNTFAALGRFAATFKLEIQPQPASADATLVVSVQDEGPVAKLRDIEVAGNKKNRGDDMIRYLGLSKGMEVTQDLIDEKARALTQAARFADSSLTPTAPGSDGRVSLRIVVCETDQLPPLQQPLSREERALLRLREWLMAWESRQDDLIISWSPSMVTGKGPQRFEVIVAPSGGILARAIGSAPGVEELQDLYSLVVKTDWLALFAPVDQRKLRIPLPAGYSGVFFVKLASCPDCASGFNLNLGAGLSPAQTNAGWQLRLDLLPAAFTDGLCRTGTKAAWQGDVLRVQTEDLVVRVEERTGRLLELGLTGGKSTSGAGAPDAYRLAVRFAAGAFAKAADQIEASTSTHVNAFQSRRPLGSVLGFLAAEVARAQPLWSSTPGRPPAEPQAALASALEKLLASSFLDPLQTLLREAEAPRRDQEFTIPSRTMGNQDTARQVIERAAVWCAGHAQELAPPGSWLQTLLREAAFTLKSRTSHGPAALARLAADEDLGPIGCVVVLHALLWSHQDSWATFRDLGLRRLATEDFRRDYRMLLDSRSAITGCFANLAGELGTLAQPELEALVNLLPPDGASVVREMASGARKAKDRPVTDAIGPALDEWWRTTGRGSAEADFRLHAPQSAPATSNHRAEPATEQAQFRAGLVAVVDEWPILGSEIQEKVARAEELLRRQYTNNPALFQQKLQAEEREALESLIDDELILTEAAKAGLDVTKEHLDQYLQDLIEKNYSGDSNVFLKTLAAHDTTPEDLRERHRRSDLVAAAKREKTGNLPPPTAEQIEQYYHSHAEEFWVEESVKLGIIVINKNPTNGPAPVEVPKKEAAAIHTRLVADADFAAEAKLHSQGGHAQQGGDWGWVERNVLRKELGDVAFSLKPGALSEVIETESAWYILRVADRRPGAPKPMADVRENIGKTLEMQQRSAVFKHWVGELRARTFLRYFGGVPAGGVSPQNPVVQVEIKHIGVSTLNDALIRSRLRVQEGEPVTQASVDRDIRNLYRTGDFYNLRVMEAAMDGGSKLIYLVQERPVLSGIQFTGNQKLSDRELLEKLTSRAGERLDERKLFNDSLAIHSLYQGAGYSKATVKYELAIDEKAGRGQVTFEVTEGPQ
jgi:parvulin-like peptidyl-prolyl isomerase